jgi:hypothetical protein
MKRSTRVLICAFLTCSCGNNQSFRPAAGLGGAAGLGDATGSGGVTGGNGGSSSGGMAGAAGTGQSGGEAVQPTIGTVTVLPSATTVLTGKSVQLTATVTQANNPAVTWSVVQTSGCGTVSNTGNYTAPSDVPANPICQVRATSVVDNAAFGTATLAIALAGSTGQTGVWTRANIPIANLDPNGGGAQTVVVDPVRPSDFYVFLTPTNETKTMVLKSTDYGVTWTDVNTTQGLHGNPWGAAIDPNPNRDPNTPPTLYAPCEFGAAGVWKSTDGGVTWTDMAHGTTPFDPYSLYGGVDAYHIVVLPDNPPNHVLFTWHYNFKNSSDGGFGESLDGGKTWLVHPPPANIGVSHYIMVVDKDTWLVVAQSNGGMNGVWKTSTAGRVNGNIDTAAWKKVDTLEHFHGSFGSYTDPKTGYIYAPGDGGVKRTKDKGDTWEVVYDAQQLSNVVATDKFFYGNLLSGPNLMRADRASDTAWATYTTAPADMKQGSTPYGAATSFDGTHWVAIIDADDSGVWRYIEP